MSESGSVLGVENKPEPITFQEIFYRLQIYVEKEKPGLKRFYDPDEFDQNFRDSVTRGLDMTRKLMKIECPREVAAGLSLLALWDLVVLVDNSISMEMDEDGAQVKTLRDTLKVASEVYSLVEEKGITAVRLLSTKGNYFSIKPGNIGPLMKRIAFDGLTDIGTKLRDKVLVNHVEPEMKKPVLVIIVTDGEIDGEAIGLLRDAIMSQAVELKERYGDHGPQAVAYQFAKIGNGVAGQALVGLSDDEFLGNYIDYMGGEHRLEELSADIWKIVPKLLLGAISHFVSQRLTIIGILPPTPMILAAD